LVPIFAVLSDGYCLAIMIKSGAKMKIRGLAIILGVVSLITLASRARAENSCSSFFASESLTTNSQNSDQQFLRSYLKTAGELITSKFKASDDFQSDKMADPSKINFIKKNSEALEQLVSKGDLSLENVVKAKVFLTEAVNDNLGTPHSYVMVIDGNVHSFQLSGNKYQLLNQSKVGYKKTAITQFLRLGRTYDLLVLNEKAYIYPLGNKDPSALAELAKGEKLEGLLQNIYSSFKNEFSDILTHTTITISDLTSAPILKTTTETNETVYILTIQSMGAGTKLVRNIYLSTQPKIVENSNKKRWGELSFSTHAGYDVNAKLKLKTDDNVVLFIEDGVLKLSNEAKAVNLLFSLQKVVEDSKTSAFRSTFIKKYGKVIEDLIQKNNFDEIVFDQVIAKLDLIVNSRDHTFYTLPSRKGQLYFDIKENHYGLLKDLSVAQFGKVFYNSNNEMFKTGRSVGFLSTAETKVQLSDDISLNKKAFVQKIEVSIGASINEEQIKLLNGMVGFIKSKEKEIEGPLATNLSSSQLLSIGNNMKTDLVANGKFTKEQAEEIIKVLF
jgi:hypothetical protein